MLKYLSETSFHGIILLVAVMLLYQPSGIQNGTELSATSWKANAMDQTVKMPYKTCIQKCISNELQSIEGVLYNSRIVELQLEKELEQKCVDLRLNICTNVINNDRFLFEKQCKI
jgi:hypothetical protein